MVMGRPSQGRSEHIQWAATPQLKSWLESQAVDNESLSKVIFRLLEAMRKEDIQKMNSPIAEVDFSPILEAFMVSDEFKAAIISSTKASWGGSDYKVELQSDGIWRVLWSNQIGNRYDSPGIILGIPVFTDDGTYQEAVNGDNPMTEDEYFDLCFANDEEELKQEMRDKLAGVA